MSISANIITEITFLESQVQQYTPLANAPHAAIVAMQLNAAKLVSDVQAALVATSLLDTYVAAVDQVTIISGVLTVFTAADDQANLALKRGIVGRVASNLDQF